jgi:hypothetical protein
LLDRKAGLARLLRDSEAGILLNEHVAEDGPTVFAHACRLGAEGIFSKKVDGKYRDKVGLIRNGRLRAALNSAVRLAKPRLAPS